MVHLYCICLSVLLKISVLDQFPTELGTVKAQKKKTFYCTDSNVAKKTLGPFFMQIFLFKKLLLGSLQLFVYAS